jgi:hypothetical protein
MFPRRAITALTIVLVAVNGVAGLSEVQVLAAEPYPPTATPSSVATAPRTPGPTSPGTPVATTTRTATATVGRTSTPTRTRTATPTRTRTATPVSTATPGVVATQTTSATVSSAPTATPTAVATPAPTATAGGVAGTTYYLSPDGNDANGGTSSTAPWRTFGKAFNSGRPLKAGDALVLLDGTYTVATTGLPTINCAATGGNANQGTATQPITIRAQNERKAFLSSDGTHAGLEMFNCTWWRVEGLRAENADNAMAPQGAGYPFRFSNVSNLTARRLLGARNNRKQNTHIFAVEDSSYVLLEECEAYFFHRHAFSIWQSRYVTVRRCYANSMLYGDMGCCSPIDNRAYGDSAVSLYGTSDSIIENCISENRANGFSIAGIVNALDPSGSGGRRNQVLGSMSIDDDVAFFVASRPKYVVPDRGEMNNARDNEVRDFVAVRGAANQIFGRQVANLKIQNATLYGSSNAGLVLDSSNSWACQSDTYRCAGTGDQCTSNAQCAGACSTYDGGPGCCVRNADGCSFTATNLLSFGHRGPGVMVQAQQQSWLIDSASSVGADATYYLVPGFGGYTAPNESSYTDTIGNLRNARELTPTGMGLGSGQCIAWVPEGSNMKGQGKNGADLGATILYRYEAGALTPQPLWAPATGSFPCGAVVPGVNDGPLRCGNVHTRLNVRTNGCSFPSGYPTS